MASDELTHDGFLGGRLYVWQPVKGYRAGNDPVILAASCPARPGQSVLELGCGAGVASLCLATRVPDLELSAIERQAEYAALARRNGSEAGLGLSVFEGDLVDMPEGLKRQSFDHVIANPPFFAPGKGSAAARADREEARREETPLAEWITAAYRRLKPKGWLTLIQTVERLPDCLSALSGFGDVSVLPLQPRVGREAGRVILRARKGTRGPFRLLAPILIHEGAGHDGDRDSYSAAMTAVLRDGAALVGDPSHSM